MFPSLRSDAGLFQAKLPRTVRSCDHGPACHRCPHTHCEPWLCRSPVMGRPTARAMLEERLSEPGRGVRARRGAANESGRRSRLWCWETQIPASGHLTPIFWAAGRRLIARHRKKAVSAQNCTSSPMFAKSDGCCALVWSYTMQTK